MSKNFYITTTLPYVNAEPHIGFALEIIQADVIARYHRVKGDRVFFNTGTDEHGLKIYRKALEAGQNPRDFCDQNAAKFDNLKKALDLSYDSFIRTTDPSHIKAAHEMWRLCDQNGDIYKKNYKIKYCIGCELEKTESELEQNRCPLHPNLDLEIIDEENYFFRFSNYQKPLLDLYKNNPQFVMPDFRLNEIIKFIERGPEDFSISRLKQKMPWGVPVPGDSEHVMYVWFDALTNYISCLGWPAHSSRAETDRPNLFKKFWPGIQVAGKDNLRQQAAMWQAMLLSAKLPPSKQILIHGFITSAGQKMSKSLGNVIDPFEYVNQYGTDAVRYYLLSDITPFEDGDFTTQKFEQKYQADLANGLGNLVSRITNLADKNNLQINIKPGNDQQLIKKIDNKMKDYKFNDILNILWDQLRNCDEQITKTEPWKINDQQKLKKILKPIAQIVLNVADLLQPFLPAAANKIIKNLTAAKIKKSEILFPRL
ncbi:methionine--tRNA ligase [Patescibacteria group bacterium]|nr:methionine--tRNA ligase [Patescibacteria group bacterium]